MEGASWLDKLVANLKEVRAFSVDGPRSSDLDLDFFYASFHSHTSGGKARSSSAFLG